MTGVDILGYSAGAITSLTFLPQGEADFAGGFDVYVVVANKDGGLSEIVLDPLMQEEFRLLLREMVDEGRTAFLSSHSLDEVERVADRVAIIHQGRILLTAAMDEIKDTHRKVTLRFGQPLALDHVGLLADIRLPVDRLDFF